MLTWFDKDASPVMIAEVALSHDGSLGTAHAYIDAVARTGAHAVKFQTHLAEAESTLDEPWRVKFSRQDPTRYDYWKRTSFTGEQWRGLAVHAAEKGLTFLSSAFSNDAVDLLDEVGVPAWKVGAGEVSNLPMIERMAKTGKPVLLSSGMSRWSDLDAAVETVTAHDAPVAVLQCTTAYPCPPEKLGLNVMAEIRKRYGCPTGLSDHSGTIFAGLAAATLGARFIEVHVVFSKECFGPDVPASITTGELTRLCEGVRFVDGALRHPVNKDRLAEDFTQLRAVFGKSVVAQRDLPAGHSLTAADLAFKKPGHGISASRYRELLDRRLRRPVPANAFLSEEDLELSEAS